MQFRVRALQHRLGARVLGLAELREPRLHLSLGDAGAGPRVVDLLSGRGVALNQLELALVIASGALPVRPRLRQ